MFPDLERDAMDLIALANEHCCGDGAIDSTAHAEKNCWTAHRTGIVLGEL
jgi:hypothetical protein